MSDRSVSYEDADRWLKRLAAGETLASMAGEIGITVEGLRTRLKALPGYRDAVRAGRISRSPLPKCRYCGTELPRGWKVCKRAACRGRKDVSAAAKAAQSWGGRPRQGDEVQSQFWLNAADRQFLESLGNGNMSEGLRVLIDRARSES